MADKKLTPEQAFDLVIYLGLGDVENVDSAKETFSKTYFKPENFLSTDAGKAFVGKYKAENEQQIRKVLKDFAIDISKSDTVELGMDGLVKAGFETLQLANNSAMEKVKSQFDATTDDKYKALELKYKTTSDELGQTSKLVESLKSQHQTELTTFKQREVDGKRSNMIASVYGGLKFRQRNPAVESQEQYDLLMEGFKGSIEKKYDMVLDDKDSLTIKTKKGELIPNPKSHGVWLSPQEVIEMDATKAGILSTSDNAGKVVGGKAWSFEKTDVQLPTPVKGKATVHPGALAAAQA